MISVQVKTLKTDVGLEEKEHNQADLENRNWMDKFGGKDFENNKMNSLDNMISFDSKVFIGSPHDNTYDNSQG